MANYLSPTAWWFENEDFMLSYLFKMSTFKKHDGFRNEEFIMSLTSSKWVSLKYFFPISVFLTLSKPLPSVSTNLQYENMINLRNRKKLISGYKHHVQNKIAPVIWKFVHETIQHGRSGLRINPVLTISLLGSITTEIKLEQHRIQLGMDYSYVTQRKSLLIQ